ncbi:MAG: glycosyltransferase family 4 protein [Prolixibacteraceae bacterium]
MKKQSILFVYVDYSTFVHSDFEILSSFAMVSKYQFKPVKGLVRTGIELFRQLIFLIFQGFKYDSVFIWFSDYHSLLPVLFAKIYGKKSFVVIGGFDVASLPEFNYGALSNPVRAFFSRNTLKLASLCFPVAEALKKKLLGINPNARCEVIATRQDSEKFSFEEYERPKRIVTVSGTKNYQRLMVKGLDRFRELALLLPEFEFQIIGATETVRHYFEPLPANLVLLPSADFGQMCQYYRNSSFYAQLSRSEGLPNALCEAMLCGCIPVGTDVGDVRLAIGNTGLAIDEWVPEQLADFIRINHNNNTLRDAARARIADLYPPGIRKEKFSILLQTSPEGHK